MPLFVLQVGTLIGPSSDNLKSLTLKAMGLSKFPRKVTASLEQLTELDLSCNDFVEVPQSIAQITTLCTLSFFWNVGLQMVEKDLDLFAAMPQLKILNLSKKDRYEEEEHYWSNTSVGVMLALKSRTPHLRFIDFI
jgi:hypothetical protein